MTDTTEEERLSREDLTFAKVMALQVIAIQMLKIHLKGLPKDDRKKLIESLTQEAEKVNAELNQGDDPIDKEWRKEFSVVFDTIYGGSLADVEAEEGNQ